MLYPARNDNIILEYFIKKIELKNQGKSHVLIFDVHLRICIILLISINKFDLQRVDAFRLGCIM